MASKMLLRAARIAIGTVIGALLIVVFAAASLTPPAVATADGYLTIAAILLAATAVTTMIVSPRRHERAVRLAGTVVLLAAGAGWYEGQLAIHERQFDLLVQSQQASLRLTALELSGNIENFLRDRESVAPPRPAPATWDHDVDAVLQFDADTSILYERRFGPQVRRTCEVLGLEGLTDPDLRQFYRSPSNAFQIDIVARKIAVLARRLPPA
jgi:hypothetical protein